MSHCLAVIKHALLDTDICFSGSHYRVSQQNQSWALVFLVWRVPLKQHIISFWDQSVPGLTCDLVGGFIIFVSVFFRKQWDVSSHFLFPIRISFCTAQCRRNFTYTQVWFIMPTLYCCLFPKLLGRNHPFCAGLTQFCCWNRGVCQLPLPSCSA